MLFLGGLAQLAYRFYEYQSQERQFRLFEENVRAGKQVLVGVDKDSLVANRYQVLKKTLEDKVQVDQSALASTLLADQSSRNSFLKFVHNVLILTGVFGTIISLSLSLIGASELLQIDSAAANVAERSSAQETSLGVMIYGMSTALSTTLTAIVAYLFFGYFFIKLTDIQTYLISRLEEITAIIMIPTLTRRKGSRDAHEPLLIGELDEARKQHLDAANELHAVAEKLTQTSQDPQINDHLMALQQLIQINSHHVEQSSERLETVIDLLKEGFRIGSDNHKSDD